MRPEEDTDSENELDLFDLVLEPERPFESDVEDTSGS